MLSAEKPQDRFGFMHHPSIWSDPDRYSLVWEFVFALVELLHSEQFLTVRNASMSKEHANRFGSSMCVLEVNKH